METLKKKVSSELEEALLNPSGSESASKEDEEIKVSLQLNCHHINLEKCMCFKAFRKRFSFDIKGNL